ncbi:MAG: hypothetical protein KDD66_15045 [Bdellovibrionales bacterium]|nr:hypothetical protein [Bdellovibrionales bacterium]
MELKIRRVELEHLLHVVFDCSMNRVEKSNNEADYYTLDSNRLVASWRKGGVVELHDEKLVRKAKEVYMDENSN